MGSVPSRSSIKTFPGSTFCPDFYFSICSTLVLPQQHIEKYPAKSAGGRLQLNTRAPCLHCTYVAANKVTVNWCMVVWLWCTQNVCQDSSNFTWHQPCNNQTALYCKYTTSVNVMVRNALCKATLIQSHIGLECNRSAQKQRMALYICHCEALRAHLKMKHSTSFHI